MPEDGTNPTETDPTQSDSSPPTDPEGGSEPQPRVDPGSSEGGQFTSPNDPDWAQGRSREEIIGLAESALRAMQSYDPSQGRQPQQQPQQPTGPQMPTQLGDPYDENFAQNLQAYIDQRVDQARQEAMQTLGPITQNLGQMARREVSADKKFAQVFAKWGHEVDQLLVNVPMQQRTVEAYEFAASKIMADHFDELVADRLAQSATGGASSGTASSAPAPPSREPVYDDPLDEFWDSDHPFIKQAKSQGLDKQALRGHIAAMGLDVNTYISSIKNQETVYSGKAIVRRDMRSQRERQTETT